jgi:hypothetical protein
MALYRAAHVVFVLTDNRKRIALLSMLTFAAMC